MSIWNKNGEAYIKSNGEIISLKQAEREGRQIRKAFDNGYARKSGEYLYPDDGD